MISSRVTLLCSNHYLSTIFCIETSACLTAKSFIHFSINSDPQHFPFSEIVTQLNLGRPIFFYDLRCCKSLTLNSCIFQQTLILSKSLTRNERYLQLPVVLSPRFNLSALLSVFIPAKFSPFHWLLLNELSPVERSYLNHFAKRNDLHISFVFLQIFFLNLGALLFLTAIHV